MTAKPSEIDGTNVNTALHFAVSEFVVSTQFQGCYKLGLALSGCFTNAKDSFFGLLILVILAPKIHKS